MLRRSSIALALCLAVGTAGASAEAPNPAVSQAKPAKKRVGRVPFRVVKLLPETGQALVYDQDRRAHVLVSEGDRLGNFDIVEVDEDSLVVARDGRELVLVTDPKAPRLAPDEAPVMLDPYGAGVVDPYASASARPAAAPSKAAVGAPIDPYAGEVPTEVLAPPDQRASLQGVIVVDPYAPATPAEPKVVQAPTAATPIKPTPAPGGPTAVEALRGDIQTVKRTELEAALSDFARLGKDIGFTRLPRGVRLGKVTTGSYFWKLGLRDGDVVSAIDGKPLRTLDDAAAAYARLGSAQKLAVDVERGNARGTLRFVLK